MSGQFGSMVHQWLPPIVDSQLTFLTTRTIAPLIAQLVEWRTEGGKTEIIRLLIQICLKGGNSLQLLTDFLMVLWQESLCSPLSTPNALLSGQFGPLLSTAVLHSGRMSHSCTDTHAHRIHASTASVFNHENTHLCQLSQSPHATHNSTLTVNHADCKHSHTDTTLIAPLVEQRTVGEGENLSEGRTLSSSFGRCFQGFMVGITAIYFWLGHKNILFHIQLWAMFLTCLSW